MPDGTTAAQLRIWTGALPPDNDTVTPLFDLASSVHENEAAFDVDLPVGSFSYRLGLETGIGSISAAEGALTVSEDN